MRVIAGALGGRRLVAPRGMETRPTSERVREALFSALGPLSGASVLDLYAGTGALGIEALSRGASRAVFVESDRAALAALRENLGALDLAGRSVVIAKPVARAAQAIASHGPFDLLLIDPPYAEASNAIAHVVGLAALIGPGSRIVLEHATRSPPETPSEWSQERTRRYGDTSLSFYRLAPA